MRQNGKTRLTSFKQEAAYLKQINPCPCCALTPGTRQSAKPYNRPINFRLFRGGERALSIQFLLHLSQISILIPPLLSSDVHVVQR